MPQHFELKHRAVVVTVRLVNRSHVCLSNVQAVARKLERHYMDPKGIRDALKGLSPAAQRRQHTGDCHPPRVVMSLIQWTIRRLTSNQ
eukprot:6465129-Amphidinium_carterae.1